MAEATSPAAPVNRPEPVPTPETVPPRPITLLDFAKGAWEAGKVLWTHRDAEGHAIRGPRELMPAMATAFMRRAFPEIQASQDRWQDVFTIMNVAQQAARQRYPQAEAADLGGLVSLQVNSLLSHLTERGLATERVDLVKKGFSQLMAVKMQLENEDQLTLAQLAEYKMLMNGIMVTITSQVILGDVPELPALSAQTAEFDWTAPESYEQVRQEYQWVIDGQAANPTQKRLLALHRMLMASGVFDDLVKLDAAPDEISYWTTAMTEYNGNNHEAQKALYARIEAYLQQANQFGITRWLTVPIAMTMMEAAPLLQPALLGLDRLVERFNQSTLKQRLQNVPVTLGQVFDPRPHRQPLQNQPPPEPVAAPAPA